VSLHDDLKALVRARQMRAHAAGLYHWRVKWVNKIDISRWKGEIESSYGTWVVRGEFRPAQGEHIAHENPGYVWRQCERDLYVLDVHAPTARNVWRYGVTCQGHSNADVAWPCVDLIALAYAYDLDGLAEKLR